LREHGLAVVAFASRVFARVSEQQVVARTPRDDLDRVQDLRRERVRDVGDDDPEGF